MPRVGKNKQALARGTRRKCDSLVLVPCRFDEETFSEISEYCKSGGISFSEGVRRLVEFGLMDINQKYPDD